MTENDLLAKLRDDLLPVVRNLCPAEMTEQVQEALQNDMEKLLQIVGFHTHVSRKVSLRVVRDPSGYPDLLWVREVDAIQEVRPK